MSQPFRHSLAAVSVFLASSFFFLPSSATAAAAPPAPPASLVGTACAVSEVGVTKMDTDKTGIVGCFHKSAGSPDTIWKAGNSIIPATTQRRYVFTTSQQWTVPEGVHDAFVTMAGGGASGFGWRISNAYATGSSGGYVFSQPVSLTPGEKLDIIVGTGGKGYTLSTVGIASPGLPYYIYAPPAGEPGTAGYAGTSSMLRTAAGVTLMECTGGSGAYAGGIDAWNAGPRIPGPQNGATIGSGTPPFASPNNLAAGPYSTPGGPGACGPSKYGVGNQGNYSWLSGGATHLPSGEFSGGMTPFGYGSGGSIFISGCHIAFTEQGTCITAKPGRDGVVIIDVLY